MERRINIKNRERVIKKSSGLEITEITDHWIFKIFAILISVVIFYYVYNSVTITIQKLEILKKAEQEVNDLRVANLHLSLKIKEMSTDKYLEKEARDRLNFGGTDEIVFVISENSLEIADKRVEEVVNPKQESVHENGNNILEWIDFLVIGI